MSYATVLLALLVLGVAAIVTGVALVAGAGFAFIVAGAAVTAFVLNEARD